MPATGTAVTFPVGDPLMARTATEYRRLIIHRDAIDYELAKRSVTLRQGLSERHRTSVVIAGIEIRAVGNNLIVSVIDR